LKLSIGGDFDIDHLVVVESHDDGDRMQEVGIVFATLGLEYGSSEISATLDHNDASKGKTMNGSLDDDTFLTTATFLLRSEVDDGDVGVKDIKMDTKIGNCDDGLGTDPEFFKAAKASVRSHNPLVGFDP
jgi:hypothetical protein